MPDASLTQQFEALAAGRHGDPFSLLGVHRHAQRRLLRTLQPHAKSVRLVDRDGACRGEFREVHPGGLFEVELPPRLRRYRLQVVYNDGNEAIVEDPYRLPSTLGEVDRYLLAEGSHQNINKTLGSHCMTLNGITGTRFAVWAPNASRVSVVAAINGWDGRCHPMRKHPANGIWELFIPGVTHGDMYKYELLDSAGRLLPLKNDPLAHYFEAPPGNASIVYESRYRWRDAAWMSARPSPPDLTQAMCVYEVHPGSWRRGGRDGREWLSWRELADQLVTYVVDMGFTHIELLPVTEHPFDGSWGYQPIGLYAPTQRFGEPDDFRFLVDCCHQAGIGVIVDWVPAHFPRDEHGLVHFDGTALYEHADPRKGEHTDWGTLIFNYGRREVVNYLLGSALHWIDDFHIDGLRVDAVASMLYLDYSRNAGEWLPNEQGGNENLEAVQFLRRFNEVIHARGAISLAEESTAWPGVSRPVYDGGLGFTYKWNMGWMNDTLRYIHEDPVHRRHHHDKMTFGLVYAFNENFMLPLSHDEVVHGKCSLLGRMPGDEFQRYANLRAYFGFMYAHPGKKLLFMGSELAQYQEWNHDQSLDWHLLEYAPHRGVQQLVRDLNCLCRDTPALHEIDFSAAGFRWLSWDDRDNSVLSWLRLATDGRFVACVCNFTPVVRHDYRIGVPQPGAYREIMNTDASAYGGSGVHNEHEISTAEQPMHGYGHSVALVLPPLSTVLLAPAADTTGAR